MKKFSKGFTLIELLVVIAIIGILSSIVLASLSTARSKGKDAAIQEQLASLRNAAEIYAAANNSSYGVAFATSTCSTATAATMFSDTASNASSTLSAVIASVGSANTICAAGSTYWGAAALLSSGSWQCVDYSGKSETVATKPLFTTAGTICP